MPLVWVLRWPSVSSTPEVSSVWLQLALLPLAQQSVRPRRVLTSWHCVSVEAGW